MSQFTLTLFNPNTLLPHRAGIAGLALALSHIEPEDAPIKWNISDDAVDLNWECTDKEALEWLLQQTYQIQDGLLIAPSLKLSQQGKYAFSQGVIKTFLQHNQQRKQEKAPTLIPIVVENDKPEVIISFNKLIECYYLRELKKTFTAKGELKSNIPIKGHHVPGLVECYIHGEYQESPQGFIPLLFLPLACNYNRINSGYALIIPEITNLNAWITRRQQHSAYIYKDFRSPSAGEAGLRLLLQEQTIDNLNKHKINYCEVYQLGKQSWDKNQNGLKQAVYRIRASDDILAIYQSAVVLFPSKVRTNDKDGKSFISLSKVLPWIAENLVAKQAWYSGFYEFHKANDIYERKGLISMTENFLKPHEQKLFDAVQGAFRVYLSGQNKQAQSQSRKLDYQQVTDKVIYRLQRPNTQQEFAKVLVDFISQFRGKACKGVGTEIYAWIHGSEWRKSRDLALLAIATYKGESKNNKSESAGETATNTNQELEAESEEYVEIL